MCSTADVGVAVPRPGGWPSTSRLNERQEVGLIVGASAQRAEQPEARCVSTPSLEPLALAPRLSHKTSRPIYSRCQSHVGDQTNSSNGPRAAGKCPHREPCAKPSMLESSHQLGSQCCSEWLQGRMPRSQPHPSDALRSFHSCTEASCPSVLGGQGPAAVLQMSTRPHCFNGQVRCASVLWLLEPRDCQVSSAYTCVDCPR